MPCFSRITQTNMTDHEKLWKALKALGYTDVTAESLGVLGKSKRHGWLTFERSRAGLPFMSTDTVPNLGEIQKKYAEEGVRAWAAKNKFAVTDFDEATATMTLQNRRG